MSEKKSVLNRQLNNAKMPTILGMPLCNANGDLDVNSAGFKYVIDTMTYIRSRIVEQKFYKVPIADYFPVDVGEAAWAEEIVQNLAVTMGGDFFQGDINTHTGNGKIASVDAALFPIRMPVHTWSKASNWTVVEIAKAAATGNWDIVEARMQALKTDWDLGIQEVGFLGHPVNPLMTGLLNDSEVNINTTVIPEPISEMDETEFQTFVTLLLATYYANTNDTSMPDTFVMPTSDYLGLGSAASATFPNITKLEYLLNAFKKMSRNEKFQILPLAYCEAARNAARGIDKNRYALYINESETLSMAIPVDFTMLDADTSNKMNWQQPGYGQYSGVLINRKREVLYLDETTPAT